MNAIQTRVIEKLKGFLSEKDAEDAEKGIFNRTVELSETNGYFPSWKHKWFSDLYITVAIRVIKSKDYFIKNKGVVPHAVPYLKPYDLNPIIWKDIKEKEDAKFESMGKPKDRGTIVDGIFKCGKCHNTKIKWYQEQTRSADEPATNFYQCKNQNCGHRWRN